MAANRDDDTDASKSWSKAWSKDGSITMSRRKLHCMLAVALCLGIALNDLFPPLMFFPNHRLGRYLDFTRRSVEEIQEASAFASADQERPTNFGGGAFDPGSTHHDSYNRTITLVHVGKAGGSSIRTATKVLCRRKTDPKNPQKILQRVCAVNPKVPKTKVPMVGQLVQDVFHMWGFNKTLLPSVSTYLVTIRHPVERIISSYRYSHPENCLPEFHNTTTIKPWGCQLIKNKKLFKPEQVAHNFYNQCFPSAAMEDFAQALGSPLISNPHFDDNLTEHEQWECRRLARSIVRGGKLNHGTAPHMQYNYQYYANKTLEAHPNKEVLAVRTEHQWTDLVHVDEFVGGDGNFFRAQGKNVTHGSSSYLASPLSTEAYQKLCCILVEEINSYQRILERSVNLSPESKQQSVQEVYDSCGIVSWEEWKSCCQQKLLEDDAMIERQYVASLFTSR